MTYCIRFFSLFLFFNLFTLSYAQETVLHQAIKGGRVKEALSIIKNEGIRKKFLVFPTLSITKIDLWERDRDGNTALHLALERPTEFLEVARLLIQDRPYAVLNLNYAMNSPLHIILYYGGVHLNTANPSKKDEVLKREILEIIDLLIKPRDNTIESKTLISKVLIQDNEQGYNCLKIAARYRDFPLLKKFYLSLIQKSEDQERKDMKTHKNKYGHLPPDSPILLPSKVVETALGELVYQAIELNDLDLLKSILFDSPIIPKFREKTVREMRPVFFTLTSFLMGADARQLRLGVPVHTGYHTPSWDDLFIMLIHSHDTEMIKTVFEKWVSGLKREVLFVKAVNIATDLEDEPMIEFLYTAFPQYIPNLEFIHDLHHRKKIAEMRERIENSRYDFLEDSRISLYECPLSFAVKRNKARIVFKLLQLHPQIKQHECINFEGDPILHQAVRESESEVLQSLLEGYLAKNGNSPGDFDRTSLLEARNSSGHTPLHLAVTWKKYEMVEMLLRYGSNPNSWVSKGATPYKRLSPLGIAIKKGNLKLVKTLLDAGANPHAGGVDKEGHDLCTFYLACGCGEIDIVKTLVKKGLDHSCKNENRSTPLHYAAKKDFAETVQYLLELGFNPNTRDGDNSTPLDIALSKMSKNSATILMLGDYYPRVFFASTLDNLRIIRTELAMFLENRSQSPEYEDLRKSARYLKESIKRKAIRLHCRDTMAELKKELSGKPPSTENPTMCLSCEEPLKPNEVPLEGPANCQCRVCQDCCKPFVASLWMDTKPSLCPGCKGIMDPNYLLRLYKHLGEKRSNELGLTNERIENFGRMQVDRYHANLQGWTSCCGVDCPAGKVLQKAECPAGDGKQREDQNYFFCSVCAWEGCLNCGHLHENMTCEEFQGTSAENSKTIKRYKKLLQYGRLAPLFDYDGNCQYTPNQKGYYFGRNHPCPYEDCRQIIELQKGCDHVTCIKCNRKIDWTFGFKCNVPPGTSFMTRKIRQYELRDEYGRPMPALLDGLRVPDEPDPSVANEKPEDPLEED